MGFFDLFKKKQDKAAAAPQEDVQQAEQRELEAGLEKTKSGFFSKLTRAIAGRRPSMPTCSTSSKRCS